MAGLGSRSGKAGVASATARARSSGSADAPGITNGVPPGAPFVIPGASAEPEDLARAVALATPALPDRDPRPAMHLPGAVPPDEGGLLVDAEDMRAPWCLQSDQGGHRLRPKVVVRDDRGARDEPEPGPPAQRPRHQPDAKVESMPGEDHRPGRATCEHGSALVRHRERTPDRRAAERVHQVRRLAPREVDQVSLPDRLRGGAILRARSVAD